MNCISMSPEKRSEERGIVLVRMFYCTGSHNTSLIAQLDAIIVQSSAGNRL